MKIFKPILYFAFLILTSIKVEAQYDCSSPAIISSLPYNLSNLMTSTGLSFEASGVCDDNYEEQDYIFKYMPQVEEQLQINVSLDNPYIEAAGIYVFTACAQPPTNCIAWEPHNFGNGGISLALNVTPANEYFIFVGTEGSESFNIEINKTKINGVAINKTAPTQTLDVNGALRIAESQDIPYEGTLKWNGAEKEFQGFDGSNWSNLQVKYLNDLEDAFMDYGNWNEILGRNISLNFNGIRNTMLGSKTFEVNSGNRNVYIGAFAGNFNSGNENVIIGNDAVFQTWNSLSKNVIIGNRAGNPTTLGDGNILIGYYAGTCNNSLTEKLVIDNNNLVDGCIPSSDPLIFGDFSKGYLLLNNKQRIGNEVFSATGDSLAQIIVNSQASPQYTATPSFGFATNGYNRASIKFEGLHQLSFQYQGWGGTAEQVDFDGYGQIIQYSANAIKGTAGEWISNSDKRLKKNVRPLDSNKMLEKVLQMKGVEFEWNDNVTKFNRPEGKQIGFIAQDLQRIFPEKINEDEQGYLLASYGTYDPVLVEAIKSLNKKLENLETKYQELLQKNTTLELEFNKIKN